MAWRPFEKLNSRPTKGLTKNLKDFLGNKSFTVKMSEESFSDVLVPMIIIIMLFLVNTVVLFFIWQYKKRKTALYTEEELGTMPVGSVS